MSATTTDINLDDMLFEIYKQIFLHRKELSDDELELYFPGYKAYKEQRDALGITEESFFGIKDTV